MEITSSSPLMVNIKTIAVLAILTRFFLAYIIQPKVITNQSGSIREKHLEKLYLAKVRYSAAKKNINFDVDLAKANVSKYFEERRKNIEHVCQLEHQRGNQLLKESNQLHGKRWNMYFDYQDNLMVCTIDKVSSTTLLFHFKKLAMLRYPEYINIEKSRDETRDFYYALKTGPAKSVEEASKMLVTASFVRHPFHRLVSAYRDKIGRRCTRFFTPIRKMIVETYRKPLALIKSYINPLTNEWLPFPSPYEFAQYLLDEIPKMGDVLNVNRHFAAQYTQCPFCSLPFDIVGSQESFNSDIKITFENVNLLEHCDVDVAENKRGSNETTPEELAIEFFSKIPKALSWKIFKYYELDFDLFGYDKEDALRYVEAGLDHEPM